MRNIVKKLVDDLRWRLSPAGRSWRPKRKEQQSWGALRIPGTVPFLLWLAYVLLTGFGFSSISPVFTDGFFQLLLGPIGWILWGVVLGWAHKALNRKLLIDGYRKLLEKNERFALVEYHNYLNRQIKRAEKDLALGGPAEVVRLKEVQASLNRLLREGAGQMQVPVESQLSEEVQLAEAVVETYNELAQDPLEELDSRLPLELRQRIEELDTQAEHLKSRELE